MKVKALVFLFVVAFLGFSLSGCGCFVESTKVETAQPVAKPAVGAACGERGATTCTTGTTCGERYSHGVRFSRPV